MSSFGNNCHVFAIDYRGFGDSQKVIPTEKTINIDALSAYHWLVSKGVSPERIIIVGHSLGSGVATQLAYHLSIEESGAPFAALITLSAYATLCDAAIGYPIVPLLRPFHGLSLTENFIKWVMSERFESVSKVKHIKRPMLFIHGARDFEIRPWQSRALFLEAAGGRLKSSLIDPHGGGFWGLRNASFDHNNVSGILVTRLAGHDGLLWTLGSQVSKTRSSADRIWLLEVQNAGHNTLSKYQITGDGIKAFIDGIKR